MREVKWYRGNIDGYGLCYSQKRDSSTPNLHFTRKGNNAHVGFDHLRNRWVVRPLNDSGLTSVGWRKKLF